jgi:hypothetical protein
MLGVVPLFPRELSPDRRPYRLSFRPRVPGRPHDPLRRGDDVLRAPRHVHPGCLLRRRPDDTGDGRGRCHDDVQDRAERLHRRGCQGEPGRQSRDRPGDRDSGPADPREHGRDGDGQGGVVEAGRRRLDRLLRLLRDGRRHDRSQCGSSSERTWASVSCHVGRWPVQYTMPAELRTAKRHTPSSLHFQMRAFT